MGKLWTLLGAALLMASAATSYADLAAIRVSELPQETAVLGALDDAQKLEPFSRSWSMEWKYPIAKTEVAARLGKDLGSLNAALKAHPKNVELLLLTGLVAHYAYNLDVDGSHDEAVSTLKDATTLAPEDIRGPWFGASLVCQTSEPSPGADEFLALEKRKPWNQLPVGFWNDYMECAEIVSMPAHVLRAADHLEKLHAPQNDTRTFLKDVAAKRFDAVDLTKEYENKNAWYANPAGDDTDFTGTACGFQMRVHGNWKVHNLVLQNGTCAAVFGSGPYPAISGSLSPSVAVIVKRAEDGQSLQDFLNKISPGADQPDTETICPVAGCIARRILKKDTYGKNGDLHGRIVVFERDEPEFPGLIFEHPLVPPTDKGKEDASYFRPAQTLKRIPGKLYYAVLLDTAASIEGPASNDWQFALKNMKVE
jgi:hypothetical protein